jgi:hypothetical protein
MLMASFPKGEAFSFAMAFHECHLGLRDRRSNDLHDSARSWVSTITRLMDMASIEAPHSRGTGLLKAERLSIDEKSEFLQAVERQPPRRSSKKHKEYWGNLVTNIVLAEKYLGCVGEMIQELHRLTNGKTDATRVL